MARELRIVSLVPSLTELVCWLGRTDWLIGRTRFCVEPISVRERVEAVGGTKDPDIGRILALAPDLVIANREENREEDVLALEDGGLEVWVTDPESIETALMMVLQMGERLDARLRASQLIRETRDELTPHGAGRPGVLVPIWWQPLMALGAETYGDDVLWQAGAANVLRGQTRYPVITMDEAKALQPTLVLLPDEPYRFRRKHVAEFERIAPTRQIDGKLLWWYGPRMPAALRTLRNIIAPARR